MHFTVDWLALGLLCLFVPPLFLIYKFFLAGALPPSLAFSHLKYFEKIPTSLRVKWAWLPRGLYLSSLACLLLAFIDPHFISSQEEAAAPSILEKRLVIPTEGIALYLVLDQSGSMAQKVLTRSSTGSRLYIPKMDLLKQVTSQLIQERSNDLIGLISFARIPRVLVPLTLDQQTLIDALQKLNVVSNSKEDGTAIGYAIFKAANLITATRHYATELNQQGISQYDIKSALILVVTDGMQDPSQLDVGNRLRTMELEEAADYAKSQNIHLYVVNIDPAFATEEYAPHRRQLQSITELTGGQFYLVNDNQDLGQIYKQINTLEKSQIPQFTIPAIEIRHFSLYPYLIALGLCFFLTASLLNALYFKPIP